MRHLTGIVLGAVVAVGCSTTTAPPPDRTATPVTAARPNPTLDTIPTTVTTAAGTLVAGTGWPATTVRGPVEAMTGDDGDGDAATGVERYPELTGFDLGPLPLALSEQQGRSDPAAVARQWAGLKMITSGVAVGPLYPYSVAAHLPALSDPAGQYVAGGRLVDVEVLDDQQVDARTATATVRVEAADPAGGRHVVTYDLELWRSDDGHWLVAFAQVRP